LQFTISEVYELRHIGSIKEWLYFTVTHIYIDAVWSLWAED